MEQIKSIESERLVLWSIIQDNSLLYDIISLGLKPECFYSTQHKIIFTELVKMGIEEKTPIDYVLLTERLKDNEVFKGCLASFLIGLGNDDSFPTAGFYCAKIVLEKYILRQTYISLVQCINIINDKTIDKTERIDSLKKKLIDTLLLQEEQREDYKKLLAIMPDALKEFQGYCIEDDDSIFLPTGYSDLDKLLGGWHKELIVLAGRTSLGKTTLALNMVYKLIKKGIPVGLFSLETTKNTIYLKLACIETRISFSKIRTKFLSTEEKIQIKTAIENIKKLPLWIDDSDLSVIDVVAKTRQMIAKEGIKFMAVDYLQRLRAVEPGHSRVQQVGYDIKTLKSLSKSLQLPILAISSLSRNYNEHNEPSLQELKESGEIEYEADVVLFLHRNKPKKKDTDERETTNLVIAKQRHGRLGKMPLVYLETGDRYEGGLGW